MSTLDSSAPGIQPALWRLVVRDLIGPAGRRSTLTSIVSVAGTAALAILVLGIFWGYGAVLRYRASVGMVFGDPRYAEYRLTHAMVEEKDREIREQLRAPESFLGCYGFVETEAECHRLAVGRNGEYQRLVGRTACGPADPLLKLLRLQAGKTLTMPDELGVVVSPKLLDELGWSGDLRSLPALRFRRLGNAQATSDSINVPVVGVTTREFSARWQFVLLESSYFAIQEQHRDVEARAVQVRPVPPGWDLTNLPNEVVDTLRNLGIEGGEIVAAKGERSCEFRRQTALLRSNWGIYIRDLRRAMTGFTQFGDEPFFTEITAMSGDDRKAVPLQDYDYVSFYTTDPNSVERLVELAHPLPSDPELTSRLSQLGTVAKLGRVVLLTVLCAVVAIGLVNLSAIEEMRAEAKSEEIGLLKAMGMRDKDLLAVFQRESMVVSMIGILLSIVVAIPLGLAAGWWLADSPEERTRAFSWLWPPAITAIVTFSTSLAATTVGTRNARKRAPIESFRAN